MSRRAIATGTGVRDRLLAALDWCHWASNGRVLAVALLLAAPVPLLMAASPAVRINYTYHDVFIPMDAAWRTLQGQWPHLDFYSPLGLAYFWQHAAAAWLGGTDGRLVIWANFLSLAVLVVPALLLARSRLCALSALVLVPMLAVLLVGPAFIDGPATLLAHLADYNRLGAAIAALVCLWALAAPRIRPLAVFAVEALAMGVLLLTLFYLKVTFFALAMAVTGIGCLTVPRFWRAALLAGVPVLLGVLALQLGHPGLTLAYLHDIARAGSDNATLFRTFYVMRAMVANLTLGVLVLALAGFAAARFPAQRWAVAGIVAAGLLCVAVASQNFGAFSPSLVVLVMLLAQRVIPDGPAQPGDSAARPALQAFTAAAVLLAGVPFIAVQTTGAVIHDAMALRPGSIADDGRTAPFRPIVWHSPLFEPLHMPDDATIEEARRWHEFLPAKTAAMVLGDGIDLLRRDGLDHRRIANLSFSNPFPMALGAPPPKGVALWWDPDRTFIRNKLDGESAIGDAEVVMVPKLWWNYNVVEELLHVTRPVLDRDFVPHESRYWTAWTRRP